MGKALDGLSKPALDDGEVWRNAHVLVDRYGSEAPTYSARKALALVGNGDKAGYQSWLRVLNAVNELLDRNSPGVVH